MTNEKKNKHPITEWLDQNILINAPIYTLKHRNLDTYYVPNDKNLLCNDEDKISRLINLNKEINKKRKNIYDLVQNKSINELEEEQNLIEDSHYVHVFKKDKERFVQYLDENTPRYHVNMLFNKIIDYCHTSKANDFKGNLLIGKKMRNEFVKFCYENRKKSI